MGAVCIGEGDSSAPAVLLSYRAGTPDLLPWILIILPEISARQNQAAPGTFPLRLGISRYGVWRVWEFGHMGGVSEGQKAMPSEFYLLI